MGTARKGTFPETMTRKRIQIIDMEMRLLLKLRSKSCSKTGSPRDLLHSVLESERDERRATYLD